MPLGLEPTTSAGIIHLFATGPGVEQNALIQISVVRFSAEAAPEEESWILNPRRRITKRLREKTGLSNKDCDSSTALSWTEAREQVQEFLKAIDVLFFVNTESRKHWLDDVVLSGMDDKPALVDLATMAHFFLPGLQRAYTDAIVDSLALPSDLPRTQKSRRALAGARVLLRDILAALYDGPSRSKILEPAAMCFFHYWFGDIQASTSRAVRTFAPLLRVALGASQIQWASEMLLTRFPDLPEFPKAPTRPVRSMLEGTLKPPAKTVRSSLNPDGCEEPQAIDPEYVSDMLDRTVKFQSASWEPRQSQKDYLRLCSEALKYGGIHAIEAGTGTGKTLGYLLPACQFATANPECQVYIASSTKNLAEQLHDHEWTKLPEDIRAPLKTAILLGKRNYLCRFTVMSYPDSLDFVELSEEDRLAWLHIFMVLRHSGGIIEDIPQAITNLLPGVTRMRREFNAESACSRDSCSNYDACTYAVSLQMAYDASIVFTNHHKLILQLSAQEAHQVGVLIIDEADQFAENARTALRAALSKTELDGLLRNLMGRSGRRGFLDRLRDAVMGSDSGGEIETHIRESVGELIQIQELTLDIAGVCLNEATQGEVQWNALGENSRQKLQRTLDEAGGHLERIGKSLELIRDDDRYKYVNDASQDTSKEVEREFRQLSRYMDQASQWSELAKQFAANESEKQDGIVHTLSAERGQQAIPSWLLTQYAFEIGDQVSELLEARHATIFTSATLHVDESLDLFKKDLFGHLADEVQLEAAPPVASEFNHQEHVMGGMIDLYDQPFQFKWPDYKKRQWHQAMACTIGITSIAMYGRSLVLFTSIRDMKKYYEWLYPVMAQYDVELLIQDGPSYAETELFRTTEHSVLFGVNRFWTGVDFPGQTCSQIIVVRTPNLSLHDPLVKHRKNTMSSGEFWSQYYHPKVRLRLIQQFGRLMRRKSDHGLFILLDSRAKRHFDIFPTSIEEYTDWKPLVERGLRHMGFTPELEARGLDLEQAWRDIKECVYSSS